MPVDVTAQAREGFDNPTGPNPYYWSSTSWAAVEAGRAIHARGATAPTKARPSRGHSVRVETAASTFLVRFSGRELDRVEVERLP